MRTSMTGALARAQRNGARRRKRADVATTVRLIFGALAFLSFLFLLGIVGAAEQDTVTLGCWYIRMAAGLAAMSLFTWLAGGFQ